MRWIAIFDDNEGHDSIRKEHSAAHFDYLGANRDKIVLAGGLRPAPEAWFCGGLWVLEVDSRDEAVRLIEQDPYLARTAERLSPAGMGQGSVLRRCEPIGQTIETRARA